MFMHMPTRWGVLVMVVAAACLGTYYVLVVRSERVGDWRVWQGSGRLRPMYEGGPEFRHYLDLSYSVHEPVRPVFSYVVPDGTPRGTVPPGVTFEYRSEWPTVLRMVIVEGNEAAWEAKTELLHAGEWTRQNVNFLNVVRRPRAGARRRPSWRIDFYNGTGVTHPSTVFSNHLELTPPGFRRED